jgi:glycosyltransferase involved in cell wall biosynthesis
MQHIVIDARIRRSSTGRYADRLLEHLQRLDQTNKYSVLVEPSDSWQGSVKNFTAIPCPYKQFSFNPVEQIGFAWQLYRLRPSLVHFTMPQQPLLFFRRRLTTVHDLTFLGYPRSKRAGFSLFLFKKFLYSIVLEHALLSSKNIIVPSDYTKSSVSNYRQYVSKKIIVTKESGEPPLHEPAKALKDVSRPFIMHVGSPLPHKNIERLIDAFETIKPINPSLILVLAGKKEFFFNKLIEEKISKSKYKQDIRLPGFIEDAKLKWLYENAEAYVLPSLSEGFGLPGLEAMAHGCPLVSSNATCLPEVYGNGAHYFDPENVDDMVAKIGEVLDNKKLRAQLIKNGHQQLKKYSWEKMARETLAIYQQILKQTG